MNVVAIIYLALYSQSQLCNWLQRDVANFVNYHGLSDTEIGALHQMGLSVGMDTFYRGIRSSSESHKQAGHTSNQGEKINRHHHR